MCACGYLSFPLKYDEAREYVERARKCLATELAALVGFSFLAAFAYNFCTDIYESSVRSAQIFLTILSLFHYVIETICVRHGLLEVGRYILGIIVAC